MGKKVALNVLYNIGIFLCIIITYSAIAHARYEYVLACAFIAGILITLKVKLIKDVKNSQKP
ncbi:hypothetical protein GWR56_04540 [Mucilaginibacter sp. 14171R-50]|uniref:DUF6358 family protein n=1 Tax=Mucilaginibacter sp. 14171R-50 TaxID=2703789 RepID=UPI00138D914F|nr:DUF6358 family protein [Mucilaginibacter sp. 14171R-50]QHS54850.1 hypothetical protein GWR56_04540 [Mucilaginibacter sp. 14171R-50]